MKRAAGAARRSPLVSAIGADHGLQFFCGRSRFPLRAAMAMPPPFKFASKLSRPHCEKKPGRQGRFPLDETRRRCSEAIALSVGDRRRPRAPVLLRPIQISAARGDGDAAAVQVRLEAEPAPLRKEARIENIAFERAFMR